MDFMEERRKAIVELINAQGFVPFAELKEHFPNVSEMTLRRDLEYLDRTKKIVRIHGGAKSLDVLIRTEDFFANRSVCHIEEKRLIASKAITLLEPGSVIFIDSGSTATEFCRNFPDGTYTIFTNSISCAYELASLSQAKIHILGGQLNNTSLSIIGSRTTAYLETINFSTAFFGVTGYSNTRGFTCGEEEEFKLKTTILRKSERVVMMMDSSKVGIVSTFTFATMQDASIIVSDGRLNPATLRQAEQFHVKVI
ncbi:MAG: DeoR/GlpR transcriptional regulator [Clostridiaceae bacterium]|nr:DeoR/GlpR transcriptional regulator [Clostridiaceae bacterium]